jgi:hypothetical protein
MPGPAIHLAYEVVAEPAQPRFPGPPYERAPGPAIHLAYEVVAEPAQPRFPGPALRRGRTGSPGPPYGAVESPRASTFCSGWFTVA